MDWLTIGAAVLLGTIFDPDNKHSNKYQAFQQPQQSQMYTPQPIPLQTDQPSPYIAPQYQAPQYEPLVYRSYSNGSNYYSTQRGVNSQTVRGYNTGTGNAWETTYRSGGSMSGVDKNGELWRYDPVTKTYTNTNGTTCVGNYCNNRW